MSPIRFLAVSLFAFAAPFISAQEEPTPVPVSGPEELRQHVEPAKAVVDRFLAFYDQGNFKAAHKLMWRSSGVDKTSEFWEKKFGKFKERTLLGIRVADTFPPEADATFIVFNYTSTFEKKKAFAQRIVVRLSEQGKYEIARFGAPSVGY